MEGHTSEKIKIKLSADFRKNTESILQSLNGYIFIGVNSMENEKYSE